MNIQFSGETRALVKKIAIVSIVLVIIIPIIDTFIFAPKRYIQRNIESGIKAFPNVEKSKIESFCNCSYNKLIKKYKIVYKIPQESNMSRSDIYDIADCLIENMVEDSLKEISRHNIDNFVDALLNQYNSSNKK